MTNMELTEIEIYYKPSDEYIYLHGYCDDFKLFGVKIENMNEKKVELLRWVFNKIDVDVNIYWD